MSTMIGAPALALGITTQSFFQWLGATFKRWWTARMMRRLEYMALRQLHAMSDRALKDIGLTRSEIASAVKEGHPVHCPRPFRDF